MPIERFSPCDVRERGAVVGHGEPTTRLCRGRVADATESAAATEVASAAATADDDSTNGTLSLEFVAFDSFKRNFPSDGAWRLEAESSDDDAKPIVAARGTFTFKPHWRPSTVRALLSASDAPSECPMDLFFIRNDFEFVTARTSLLRTR